MGNSKDQRIRPDGGRLLHFQNAERPGRDVVRDSAVPTRFYIAGGTQQILRFHFVRVGKSQFHLLDPRTINDLEKKTICGLTLPSPYEASLIRHCPADDMDPVAWKICPRCYPALEAEKGLPDTVSASA